MLDFADWIEQLIIRIYGMKLKSSPSANQATTNNSRAKIKFISNSNIWVPEIYGIFATKRSQFRGKAKREAKASRKFYSHENNARLWSK